MDLHRWSSHVLTEIRENKSPSQSAQTLDPEIGPELQHALPESPWLAHIDGSIAVPGRQQSVVPAGVDIVIH